MTDWPLFTLPNFETIAEDTMRLGGGGIEMMMVGNFVDNANRTAWEAYATKNYDWIRAGHMHYYGSLDRLMNQSDDFIPYIHGANDGNAVDEKEYYLPFWTSYPPPNSLSYINQNVEANVAPLRYLRNETVVGPVDFTFGIDAVVHTTSARNGSLEEKPHSYVSHPIREVAGNNDEHESKVVGQVTAIVGWDEPFRNLLPEGVNGINVVMTNTCNQTFTYLLDGPEVFFLGEGDFHQTSYNHYAFGIDLFWDRKVITDKATNDPHGEDCWYSMTVYPTSRFTSTFHNNSPKVYATIFAATFALITIVFAIYDIFVRNRNTKVVRNSAISGALVSSIFPEHIRKQLVDQRRMAAELTNSSKMKSFLVGGDHESFDAGGVQAVAKPLADLFLETTVIFIDIVGFTAWSSTREPFQVFQLLETVYAEFDRIAKRRRVFKVETVGDCYVAVTGLPDPMSDHADRMARFASECMTSFNYTTKRLEVSLGPDTGDLELRIGVHSGPVTAGVLRGDRSRFQLFGDTINTTARMEETSTNGRIQLSQETAQLLKMAGHEHWLDPRTELVEAKGKGFLRTFWLKSVDDDLLTVSDLLDDVVDTVVDEASELFPDCMNNLYDRQTRLIDWNTETLLGLLKKVVARRGDSSPSRRRILEANPAMLHGGSIPLEEVKEIIELPEFNHRTGKKQQDPDSVEISSQVVSQLREYVSCIANQYRNNAFHNFEHASHVAMSVIKLLSRIVAPREMEAEIIGAANNKKTAATLHDHTYGITSDPLTQFACAFSALIHDVDHVGVPNTRLSEDMPHMAEKYTYRSVAEQNSLDIAWQMLMEDRFTELRGTLFATQAELQRFRELVVNSVMATDIVDKDLKQLRNGRWDKAFKKDAESRIVESERDAVNRKATIVIEHLIQASDISHTMQHWHVYRKWNERLFEEMYTAFREGRSEVNPATFWSKGEIGFFDFYIIPLARKLKECGVFGVSSDEFLNYAIENRREWEARGEEITAEMVAKFGKEFESCEEDDESDGYMC